MNIVVYAKDDGIYNHTCSNITITHNNTHYGYHGIWVMGNVMGVLVSNNYSTYNKSCGIQIEGNRGGNVVGPTSNIIVRNNLCEYNDTYGQGEANIWVDCSDNSLVENNICRYSQKGSGVKITDSRNNIIRFNESYCNGVGGLYMVFKPISINNDNIIVHNVFYGNGYRDMFLNGGIIFHETDEPPSNRCSENVLKNNIMMNNLRYDLNVHPICIYNTFDYNNWYDEDVLMFNWAGNIYDFNDYRNLTGQDSNSISQDPLFYDPICDPFDGNTCNYLLQSSSPCIDKGGFLTSTDGSGSGNIIIVHDSRYFSDGYGYIDGDLIRVGSNSPVRVVDVNDDSNTITVDRNICWKDGDAVSYSYMGTAPDMGVYEFPTMDAILVVRPDTLNLKAKGDWITCYIELPEGYDPVDIDIETALLILGGTHIAVADGSPTEIGDYNDNGVSDLMLKFDRGSVQDVVCPGLMEMRLYCETGDGTRFEGSDSVNVIDKGKEHTSSDHSSVVY